jgi:hypothetical protein
MDYNISFRNKTDRTVDVYIENQIFLRLNKGESYSCITDNPGNIYARYLEVIYKPGGEMELVKRGNFDDPLTGLPVVELINVDGKPLESVILEGQVFHLARNIPLFYPVTPEEKLFVYSKIELKLFMKKEHNPEWPGYMKKKWVLSQISTLRADPDEQEVKDVERVSGVPVTNLFTAASLK